MKYVFEEHKRQFHCNSRKKLEEDPLRSELQITILQTHETRDVGVPGLRNSLTLPSDLILKWNENFSSKATLATTKDSVIETLCF